MTRKCFISFKTEDIDFKEEIQELPDIDMIDKSLDEPIDSDDEDYIMKKIREDYLADSTVTIHLIGLQSAEDLGTEEQKYIKRELQASLYNGENNTRNGILGIVLPSMYNKMYQGTSPCSHCNQSISSINLGDNTTVKEFHHNYHIPHGKCHWAEDDRYCVMVTWDDFLVEPNKYIEQAFEKRSHDIFKKVKVRP